MDEPTSEEKVFGKEAYEQKKKERDALKNGKQNRDKSSRTTRRTVRIVISLVVLIVAGYGLFLLAERGVPKSEDMSQTFPDQGRAHISIDSVHEPYNSNPPTSGPHYNQPARPGFRGDEDIADEYLVHSLEHGMIWISYQPEVSPEIVKILKGFGGGLVVVTSRVLNDTDIAVAAWGRLDAFDLKDGVLDEERVKDFISRYVNRGPESVPPSVHGGGI